MGDRGLRAVASPVVPPHPRWRPFEVPADEGIARARVRSPAPVEVAAPDPG
ncbi:MAG TPA: hypothetical protein VKZ81_32770 [Pseudonocardia sp.]|uniref:hypothetical protein n=1 Tax=Pseudonocardia sp. TaxID=60912 RepID=UPI002B4B5013|nr:hypothetical protein [Pseudonocardia sp.]HLU60258.1 hypothetical protein [Pseudonocardia sp.]